MQLEAPAGLRSRVWLANEEHPTGAREVEKGPDRERIQFETKSGDYGDDAVKNEKMLGVRITTLFDGYQSQVLGVLRITKSTADTDSSSEHAAHLKATENQDDI